jgi:hypothetical protein
MKFITLALTLFAHLLLAFSSNEILEKTESKISGFKSADSMLSLSIVDANGNKMVKKVASKILEEKDCAKIYLEFLAPQDVVGVKILSYQYADKSKKQWIYLPSVKKTREIKSNGTNGGAILGSDIDFEDLDLLSDEHIKVTPAPQSKEKEYTIETFPSLGNYSKMVYTIDKNTYQVKKIEYYDKKSVLAKVGTFENYKVVNGINRVGKITMESVMKKTKTILEWEKDDIFATIPAKFFSPINLN